MKLKEGLLAIAFGVLVAFLIIQLPDVFQLGASSQETEATDKTEETKSNDNGMPDKDSAKLPGSKYGGDYVLIRSSDGQVLRHYKVVSVVQYLKSKYPYTVYATSSGIEIQIWGDGSATINDGSSIEYLSGVSMMRKNE